MLVLTRRRDEEIEVEIPPSRDTRVLKLKVIRASGAVRLGFDAPLEMHIRRPESNPEHTGRAA